LLKKIILAKMGQCVKTGPVSDFVLSKVICYDENTWIYWDNIIPLA